LPNVRIATTADRLKEALKIAGKTQADLARETGIPKCRISSYIRGKYEPKASGINKLAIALGVSEMWLWGYDVNCARTISQKNNDELVEVIAKMSTSNGFRDLAITLAKMHLSDEKYESIMRFVSTFSDD